MNRQQDQNHNGMAWPLFKLYQESWYVLKRAGVLAS
jgi:hypothetical protein